MARTIRQTWKKFGFRTILVLIGVGSVLCCAGVVIIGFQSSAPYVHAYPAPGPGCGDTGEDENGTRTDNWDNPDYVVVTCHPDHVDLDSGSGSDPRGLHNPSSTVFRVESNIDAVWTSDILHRGASGFLLSVGVGVHRGGPAARGGITVQPYDSNDASHTGITPPVYFFSVDHSRQWHVDSHDVFGAYQSSLGGGALSTPDSSSPVVAHVLQVRSDARTADLAFIVDGVTVTTVHPHPFETYRLGLGVACSYAADNLQTCMSSFNGYSYSLWT